MDRKIPVYVNNILYCCAAAPQEHDRLHSTCNPAVFVYIARPVCHWPLLYVLHRPQQGRALVFFTHLPCPTLIPCVFCVCFGACLLACLLALFLFVFSCAQISESANPVHLVISDDDAKAVLDLVSKTGLCDREPADVRWRCCVVA